MATFVPGIVAVLAMLAGGFIAEGVYRIAERIAERRGGGR